MIRKHDNGEEESGNDLIKKGGKTMEIKQADSLLTFYPDPDNDVEIRCPECDAKKQLDVSNYQNNHKVIEVPE